jgi:LysM repeat protein
VADPTGDAPQVPVGPVADPGSRGVVCPLLELASRPATTPEMSGGPGPMTSAGAGDPMPDPAGGPATTAVAMDASTASGRAPSGSPAADPGNRCAASSPPAAVSLDQQRLVCLGPDHVDCPRYLRAMSSARPGGGRGGRPTRPAGGQVETAAVAAAVTSGGATADAATGEVGAAEVGEGDATAASSAGEGTAARASLPEGAAAAAGSPVAGAGITVAAGAASTDPAVGSGTGGSVVPVSPVTRSRRKSGARPARRRPGPIIVAVGILGVAVVVALAFTSIRGGLALPGASASAVAVGSPSPTVASPLPTPSASPSPSPSPTATPSASPSPSPTPTATASASQSPSASLPAAYAGLKPCPDQPDCYRYRVRPGDSLTGIAAKFGITLVALKAANPEIKNPSLLHVGDVIRIPLPPS